MSYPATQPMSFVPQPPPPSAGYPQQYPQPVQNAAQQSGQQNGDPFSDPRNTGGLAPKIRDLQGRTVIMVPTRIDENAKGLKDEVRPTAYFDLVVVDGGPLEFGSNMDENTPNTHRVDTPAYFRGTMAGNSNIVNALREQVGRGIVLGTIVRSDVGRRPYNLVRIDGSTPDGAAKRQAAQNLWFAIQSNTFVSPTPVPLFPGAAQQYAPPIQPPGYQWPVGYTVQPAQPRYAPPPPQPPASVIPGPIVTGAPAPVGWPPEVWTGLSDEQRAQVLASQQGVTPAAPQNNAQPPW